MRKFLWVFVLVISIFVPACKSTPTTPTNPTSKLTVSVTGISFPATGGTSTFNISNTGGGTMAWTAAFTSGDWISINPASGTNSGVVTVTCTTNTDTSDRTGTIRVTSSGAKGSPFDISINQMAGTSTNPILNVWPTALFLPSSSGSATLSITNTGTGTLSWSASVTSGNSWLSIQSGSSGTNTGTITVAYTQYTSTSSRSGTIRVTASGSTGSPADISVTQGGTNPILSVTPSDQTVSSSAGMVTFGVYNTGTGTLNWSASVMSGNSWLSIQSGSSGTNTGTIVLAYTQNTGASSRSGTIQVTASGATGSPVDVTVTQASSSSPPILSVVPSSQAVSSSAGTTTFNISNTGGGTLAWSASVTSGNAWLSIQSGSSGTNSGTITPAYTQNTGVSSRSGTIRVTASGVTGSPIDVTVTQAGTTSQSILSVTPSSRSVSSSAGTTTFDVSNTGSGSMAWTAAEVSGGVWISIQSGSSGTNNGTITVAFTQNTFERSRTGQIVVTANGATGSPKEVDVIQAPPPPVIAVTPEMLSFTENGGTKDLWIFSDSAGTLNWMAVVQQGSTWLSLSPSSGTGNGGVHVTCAANTGASRTGAILISDPNAVPSSKIVPVEQAAPVPAMTVSPTRLIFNATEGIMTFDISFAGGGGWINWTATVQGGSASYWVQVSPKSGNGNGKVTVHCDANLVTGYRSTTILVTAPGANPSSQNVDVQQTGIWQLSSLQLATKPSNKPKTPI